MGRCFFIAASWGGAAIPQYFKAISDRLVSQGHQVVYLTSGRAVQLEQHNFHLYSFPSSRPTKLQDALFLHRLIRKYRPDCLISNFGAVNSMILMGWLMRVQCRVAWYHSLSQPLNLDSTANLFRKTFLNYRKRLVYRFATHIIANSEAARQDVCRVYSVPKAKTHVWHPTLPDSFDPLSKGVSQSGLKMVCPGRLYLSKGQDIVIRAISLLKNVIPDLQVEFAGSGPQEHTYRTLAIELGVDKFCIFVGAVPHSDLLSRMAEADITLVPSRGDAFGLVNIESMSVATPVIASSVGGIPEIIRDGIDGYLVPPDDPDTMAAKIRNLYFDIHLRKQMGDNARQRFLDVFEQTRHIEQHVEWLEEMVSKQ